MRLHGFLVFLLVHSFAAASASVPLSFDLTPRGAILVETIVNGAGPARFMLDTGSNGSIISEELASALGATIVAKTTMVSASGRKDVLIARIEHLEIGGVIATDALMTLVPPDALNLPDLVTGGYKIQGVIGQDLLAALRYTIDYRKRRIIWHDAGARAPARAEVLELESQDDRFIALVPQDHQVLRLVPDTGAETLVLFQGEGHSRASDAPPGQSVGLTGLTGTRSAQRAVLRGLRVGSIRLTDVAAVIVGRESNSPLVDGLLPLHIFARVTFNGPERQLIVEDR